MTISKIYGTAVKKIWILGLLVLTAIDSAAEIRSAAECKAPFEDVKVTQQKFMKAKGVFLDDKIVFGNKTLAFTPDGSLKYYADGRPVLDMGMVFSAPKMKYVKWPQINMKNPPKREFKKDVKAQVCEWNAGFLVQEGRKDMVDVKQRLELVGNKVLLTWSYQAPEDMADFETSFLSLSFSKANVRAGTKVQVNYGKKTATVEFKEKLRFNAGATSKFTIFSDTPEKALTFSVSPTNTLSLYHHARDNRWCGRVMWRPGKKVRQATITIELDFGKMTTLEKSGDSYAGIDFWKNDRLHVPDFGRKNLIQNSSFESGLRYIRFHGTAAQYIPEKDFPFSVDSSEAKFGKSSLLHILKPGIKNGSWNFFSAPVKAGKPYTLSFYAKTDHVTQIRFRCVSAVWGKFPAMKPVKILPGDWKRYEVSFTTLNNGCQIAFIPDPSSKNLTHLRIDGVQLEAGSKATAYEEPVSGLELQTAKKDNFLNDTDSSEAKLIIRSKAGASGDLEIAAKDMFNRIVIKKQFTFKVGNNGEAVLPMDTGNAGYGIFVMECKGRIDGQPFTDYLRFSRMKYLKSAHKNNGLVMNQISNINTPLADQTLRRYVQVGIGASVHQQSEQAARLLAAHKIMNYGGGMIEKYRNMKGQPSIMRNNVTGESLIQNFRTVREVTPEFEKKIEDSAYQIAKSSPWIYSWYTSSENNGFGRYDLIIPEQKWSEYAKIVRAVAKGNRRANPKNKTWIDGGPTNMNPVNGIPFLFNVMNALQKLDPAGHYDYIGAHPYRQLPENPDIDEDYATLLKLMDQCGFKATKLVCDEGGYWIHTNVPEWGLDPHYGCTADHSRLYNVSYDMGWGEKISGAYLTRYLIMSLKYYPRVESVSLFTNWFNMDILGTPLNFQSGLNTFGNVLGNSRFVKDIRFAPMVRCYVFEDNGTPIAAVWSHITEVDLGVKTCPKAAFDFNNTLEKVIDFTGNEVKIDQTKIPVSSFPTYFIGKKGSTEQFCAALSAGRLLNFGMTPLILSARAAAPDRLSIRATNPLTAPFKGTIKFADKEIKLDLASMQKQEVSVTLKPALSPAQINNYDLPTELQTADGKVKQNFSFSGFVCPKVSDDFDFTKEQDWNSLKQIPMPYRAINQYQGNNGTKRIRLHHAVKPGFKGDFDATFRTAYNGKYFLIRVDVKDDKLTLVQKPDVAYRTDSIQLYFDTLCDARDTTRLGNDGNDYNYDIAPVAPDRAVVYRRFVPEQQIGEGLEAPKANMVEPLVKTVFHTNKDGWTCVAAFPHRLLSPIRFESNYCIGFNIFMNDNDGQDIRSCLSLIPGGKGGYQNPHLYPVMIFGDSVAKKSETVTKPKRKKMKKSMEYIPYQEYEPYDIGNPDKYDVFPALDYAGDKSPLHRVYLSVPKNAKNCPLVIFFPGGGLTSCGRTAPGSLWNGWCAVAEVKYRLYPKDKIPAQFEDAAQVIRYLRDNAGKYGYNPDKLIIAGQSAGSWLAAMTVFDQRNLARTNVPQRSIAGMILISGQMTTHFKVKEFTHPEIPRFVPLIDEYSPLRYVRKDLPPLLIVTGDPELDIPCRVDENRLCVDALKALGHKDARLCILQGYAHSPGIAGSAWLIDAWLNEKFALPEN